MSCCCWSSTFFTTQSQLTSCAKTPVSWAISIGATVIFTQLHILETLLLLTSVLVKYASSQIGTPTCIYFARTPDTRNDRLVNGAAIGVEHWYRSYRHLQAVRTTFYEQLPFFCRVSAVAPSFGNAFGELTLSTAIEYSLVYRSIICRYASHRTIEYITTDIANNARLLLSYILLSRSFIYRTYIYFSLYV